MSDRGQGSTSDGPGGGEGLLDGLRVLDLTDRSGFLAGRILAELGADVVKLEPPGGDPERRRGDRLPGARGESVRWHAQNASKRSAEGLPVAERALRLLQAHFPDTHKRVRQARDLRDRIRRKARSSRSGGIGHPVAPPSGGKRGRKGKKRRR